MSQQHNLLLWQIPLIAGLYFSAVSVAFANNCRLLHGNFPLDKPYFIDKITINNADVFDTDNDRENRKIHSIANELHRKTIPSVISRQLLFEKGDQVEEQTLRETERLLRTNRYLRSVNIVPVEICGDQVAIAVNTTDHWTLTPGVSYGRAGGQNNTSLEIKESNLFGRGKLIQLRISENADRSEQVIRYFDPQLFGGRQQLDLLHQENSDGYNYGFSVGKPFFALGSRTSWTIDAVDSEHTDPYYIAGEVAREFNVNRQNMNIYRGRSKGLNGNSVKRFSLGWKYDNTVVSDTAENSEYQDKRTRSYPYFQFEYLQNRFTTGSNLKLMESVEDISLGHHAKLTLGISRTEFGSSENSLILNGEYNKGIQLGVNTLGFFNIDYSANTNYSGVSSRLLRADGSIFYKQSERRSLFANVKFSSGDHLYAEQQLTLGGDSGLRGYPSRFQSGDKSALVTIEQRIFFDWYPFNLVRFGASLFADAGASWGLDNQPARTLRDIGVGLRLVPTRHSNSKVIHIDLAVPLDDRDKVSGIQLLLKAKSEF